MQYGQLPVDVYATNADVGHAAAMDAQHIIVDAIADRGNANIILATGNSQLTFLHALREIDGVDWSKVDVFHLDEYVGIDPKHQASFPRFLREHFFDFVKVNSFFPIPSQPKDVNSACREYEALLRERHLDMVALGWGENGHLAFNDPSFAKFDEPTWVKVVELDETSRKQQVGEGHFDLLDEVPTRAITLTIPALLAPDHVLCIVPEARKAKAVEDCLTKEISEERPGSILRQIAHAHLFLDSESAARLKGGDT
jgi:glucosamine-6-phosphate deaminase